MSRGNLHIEASRAEITLQLQWIHRLSIPTVKDEIYGPQDFWPGQEVVRIEAASLELFQFARNYKKLREIELQMKKIIREIYMYNGHKCKRIK